MGNQITIEELNNSLNDIYEGLVGTKDLSRLPEKLFVDNFLGYFSGNRPITKEDKVFEKWVSIAGSVTSEVEIIDQTGNVLYKVPALINTDILDIVKKNNATGFSEIFGNFDRKSVNLPSVADNYLAESYDTKANEIVNNEKNNSEDEKAWFNIFERYGLNKKTEVKEQKSNPNIGEDLVYD